MTTLTITNTTTTEELISWIKKVEHTGQKGELTQQVYTTLLAILQQAPNESTNEITINNSDKSARPLAVSHDMSLKITEHLTILSKEKDLMRYMACYVRGLYVKDKPDILSDVNATIDEFKKTTSTGPSLPPTGSPSSP